LPEEKGDNPTSTIQRNADKKLPGVFPLSKPNFLCPKQTFSFGSLWKNVFVFLNVEFCDGKSSL